MVIQLTNAVLDPGLPPQAPYEKYPFDKTERKSNDGNLWGQRSVHCRRRTKKWSKQEQGLQTGHDYGLQREGSVHHSTEDTDLLVPRHVAQAEYTWFFRKVNKNDQSKERIKHSLLQIMTSNATPAGGIIILRNLSNNYLTGSQNHLLPKKITNLQDESNATSLRIVPQAKTKFADLMPQESCQSRRCTYLNPLVGSKFPKKLQELAARTSANRTRDSLQLPNSIYKFHRSESNANVSKTASVAFHFSNPNQ